MKHKQLNRPLKKYASKTVEVKKRYFFISAMARIDEKEHHFFTFNMDEQTKHPSLREIITVAEEIKPNQKDLIILGISEFNESDWNAFILDN